MLAKVGKCQALAHCCLPPHIFDHTSCSYWDELPEKPLTDREILLELIDILSRPIQQGGQGMADCADSPLMKLKAKILLDN